MSALRDLIERVKSGAQAASGPRYVIDDGDEYINPGVEGLIASSEKLLAMNRGVVEPDDRASLSFKRILSVNDLVRERILRDSGKLRRQFLYRLARQRNLKALHPGYFNPYVEGQFKSNPLVESLEEINPMHLVENARRMTLMGPGGIGSEDAITAEDQAVSATQFGFLSPSEGPESSKAGVDTRFAYGTRIGSDGRIYQKFYDRGQGKYRYMSPEDLDGLVVKLPEH